MRRLQFGLLMRRRVSAACQRNHWDAHRASCKEHRAMKQRAESLGLPTASAGGSSGSSRKNLKKVSEWYDAVPMLPLKVMCLAWQHRGETEVHKHGACPSLVGSI
mmetsp:Transcript_7783/g.19809  ORF Transcript_7783/g.19809 Transcript_7783/m.19809 type:complete len:105 (-) Transcript_7783:55-369(-)